MKNKITGLKLEEIAKFDSEKFSSCIVRWGGDFGYGWKPFEKELTIKEVLTLYKSVFSSSRRYTKEDRKILHHLKGSKLVVPIGSHLHGSIIAKFSEYDLVRKEE